MKRAYKIEINLNDEQNFCTCSDFQNRNRICRHINAVNNAIGDEIERNQEGASIDDTFFAFRKPRV